MAANVPVVVAPTHPARNPVDQALVWIGFGTEVNCNSIRNEGGLEAFADFFLTGSDIWDMASKLSKRTTAQGLINFGILYVKYTLGIMHWAQDESYWSRTASLTGISDTDKHKALLGSVLDRSALRNVESDQAETIRKAAYPGKFKDERTWPDWEVKFENYLSTIPGVNGVPLSFVVRYQEAPDRTTYFQGEYIHDIIACAPLSFTHLQSDTSKLHQLLKNYLGDYMDEQWIRSIEKCANGRDKFDALCHPYSGDHNVSHRIATVERLWKILHYKSERAMSFSMFLDRTKNMFNIFRDEG